MPITVEQRDDILEFLHEKARDDGHEDGLTAENFLDYFFGYWDEITNLDDAGVKQSAKRKRLRDLKKERKRQDDERAGLDQEIADLEAELPKPPPPKKKAAAKKKARR